ncbi:MAG: hypothetical protein HY280_05785 [Nitrospinae bacterium]|nr:hypothetical protein [Nitrospinota bacterium]
MTEAKTSAKKPEKTAAAKQKADVKENPTYLAKTKNLLAYLHHLRSTSKELCHAISSNMERDILEIMEAVELAQQKADRRRVFKKSETTKATSILERLTIKPEKGRRGDLKKVEKTVSGLKTILLDPKDD